MSACSAASDWYDPVPPPATDPRPADATVFLVGDAGAPTPARDVVLSHLGEEVERAAVGGQPVVVAYLGDNIYEFGARVAFPEPGQEKLGAQILPLGRRPNVRGVFLPGNHDWGGGAPDSTGVRKLRLQATWLERLADGRDVTLLPAPGCPGPASVTVGGVRLLLLDTEALLRGVPGSCGTEADFYSRLTSELEAAAGMVTLVLAHHPLETGGKHGGHVAPLGRVPTLSFLAGKAGVERQDVTSVRYAEMIRRLRAAMGTGAGAPLAFAAGHEHSLQVIALDEDGPFQLVSGSVAKSSRVRPVDGTRWATDRNGYLRLDVRAGSTRLTAFARRAGGAGVGPVFGCTLSGGSASQRCPEAPRAEGRR